MRDLPATLQRTWVSESHLGWYGNDVPEQCHFDQAPVYERIGVSYIDGRASEIHAESRTVAVKNAHGESRLVDYDYCLNATGPYLNFEGTPGLGPITGNSYSCSVEHATQTRDAYLQMVAELNGYRPAESL